MIEAATRDGPYLTVIGQWRGDEHTNHIYVAESPVSIQIARPQAVGELEHAQQHRQSAEKGMRHQVPLHGSKMLCNLGSRIEDASVLHVSNKHGEQPEYHEEHKFRVRTRPANGCDDGGHLIPPQANGPYTTHAT